MDEDEVGEFRPIHTGHAVHEAVFALHFAEELGEARLNRILEIEPDVRKFLPRTRQLSGIHVEVADQPRIRAQKLSGVIFDRLQPDGQPAWLLRCEENFLSANCLTYTRWAEVWGKARSLLDQAYARAAEQPIRLRSITLQYIDRFFAPSPVSEGDWRGLFSEKSAHIAPMVYDRPDAWHLHQGWFDESPEAAEGRLLTVINISAVPAGNKPQTLVTIDSVLRVDCKNQDLALFAEEGGGEATIDKVMNHLHQENKLLLIDILSDRMCKAVGLKE